MKLPKITDRCGFRVTTHDEAENIVYALFSDDGCDILVDDKGKFKTISVKEYNKIKENNRRFLLKKLMEEAAEVAAIASKCSDFGWESYYPNDPNKTTNRELLHGELDDLLALVEMLQEYGIDFESSRGRIEAKKAKVIKYQDIIENFCDKNSL